MIALVLAVLLSAQFSALATDAPKPAPRDIKVYSPHRKFYAISFLGPQKTAVFPATPALTTPKWEIPGYTPVLFLSDDGEHLVIAYPGGNILDADARPSDAFLTFYEHGRQVARLTIAGVFPTPSPCRKAHPAPPGATSGASTDPPASASSSRATKRSGSTPTPESPYPSSIPQYFGR